MFVIQHNKTGRYVADNNSIRSYTQRLEQARVFRSKEDAEKERCVENETLVRVFDLFESMVRNAI